MAGAGKGASSRLAITSVLLIFGLAACGGGGSGGGGSGTGGGGTGGGTSPAVQIAITPTSASVSAAGGTAKFAAMVSNASDTSVTWQVNGTQGGNDVVGSIGSDGLYTAPATVPAPSVVTVTAVAVADASKSANASVTIVAPTTIGITVSPTSAVLLPGGTLALTATVKNSTNTAVTWSVNGLVGGSAAVGTVSTTGVYTAPAAITDQLTVSVTATAVADPSKVATTTVYVNKPASVTVSPATAAVQIGLGSLQFLASVANATSSQVTWKVNGVVGGNSIWGTISANGLYTPPAVLPSPSTVTISAASTVSLALGTATVTLMPPVAVTTSPLQACLHPGDTTTITAVINNDAANAGVHWSLAGSGCAGTLCGSLSSVTTNPVTYAAPASLLANSTVSIQAWSNTDPSRSSTTTVTLLPVGISIDVSPHRAAVTPSQRQSFTAKISNACNSAVTWSVDGIAGGNSTVGTIDTAGTYVPPSSPGIHVVAATSLEDPSKSASATVATTDLAGVPTYHYDNARTGRNTREYALAPATLRPGSFGRVFACVVDGDIYAEPLYVANLGLGGGTHNVVLIATEHDSVYAFDADDPGCRKYWMTSFLGSAITTIPAAEAGENGNLSEVGITGTPVIDLANQILYVVVATKEGTSYFQRLHALDLSSGQDKPGSPVTIAGSAQVPFNPLIQAQRSALLLANNVVYVAWASHDDLGPYVGIIMGFDAASLTAVSAFGVAPHGTQGGIWMSGSGPAADSAGNLYLSTGNGTFDDFTGAIPPIAPNDDFGDSVLKLSTSGGLALGGFFTPFDQAHLKAYDLDLGSGGVALLPDEFGSSAHPHLLLTGDKLGRLYLLDRDNLGGYTAGGPDQDLQALLVTSPMNSNPGIFSTPAISNGTVFVAPGNDALKAFSVSSASVSPTAISQSNETQGWMGATPVITSQGTANGIVWVLDTDANGTFNGSALGPAILRAYDASDLRTLLYSSDARPGDQCGLAIKFTLPTVANGKAYIGGRGQLTVYGLLQ